jgi:hypothetical protein
MKHLPILVLILFLFMGNIPVSATESDEEKDLALLSDELIQKRQLFIEERLDAGRRHALYWQQGWTGFYSASMVVQGVLGVTENDKDDRVKNIVGALKSGVAFAELLLNPIPGRYGADELRNMPTNTPTANLRRLNRGEQLLQRRATRAANRRIWKPHLKVLGLNLVGAVLIAGFGDEDDALPSTALGIAVGEAAIWSQPWLPEADLQDYRNRFPPSRTGLNWKLVPTPGGIAITGNF